MIASSWRVNPLVDICWRDWGAESVAFENVSGGTHLYEPLSAAVFSCFEEGSASLDIVTEKIAFDLGAELNLELTDLVASIVTQFVKLGWLEPTLAR